LPKISNLLEKLLRLTVAEYIKQLLSWEEYSFSLQEIKEKTGKNDVSIRSELSRLIEKKEIFNLRKGFYIIMTPRYFSFEKLPIQLYSEKLFKYLNRKYYIGLYTAAKTHGASHQQVHRDYIIIERPKLIDIKKTSINIRFITSSQWPKNNIQTRKSDAGLYHISSPALTMLDLINYQSSLGGLNRILPTLEELSEEIEENDLTEVLIWYSKQSNLQRLGYLLEHFGTNEIHFAQQIFEHLSNSRNFPILLCPESNQKPGAVSNRWKVVVNIKLESDL